VKRRWKFIKKMALGQIHPKRPVDRHRHAYCAVKLSLLQRSRY
jgi:hypothetical protein